jgi:maltose alpha-D-glucosyltransferase/alpha-amylase
VEHPEGAVRFESTAAAEQKLRISHDTEVNWLSAEQSNSSLTIGDAVMLKLFRRIAAGEHPEAEVGRYLTAAGFAHAPPLLGEVVRVGCDGTTFTLAVALGFVRNQGNAWSWMLDLITRALEALAIHDDARDSQADLLADCEAFAGMIGRRLGEMHAILARPAADVAFAPQSASAQDAAGWARQVEIRLESALQIIRDRGHWERREDAMRASELARWRKPLSAAVRRLARAGEKSLMTRIHGDFHLGQVLVASGDAYLIDFEGEPARPLSERRAKASPLRDVAGLLRSIDYVAAALLDRPDVGAMPVAESQRDEVINQFRTRASRAFLKGYRQVIAPASKSKEQMLLDLFLIDKAAYEVEYEANNRPTWIGVPLAGLWALATRILRIVPGDRNG